MLKLYLDSPDSYIPNQPTQSQSMKIFLYLIDHDV